MNKTNGNNSADNVNWNLFQKFEALPEKVSSEKSSISGLAFLKDFAERIGLIKPSNEKLQKMVDTIKGITPSISTEVPSSTEEGFPASLPRIVTYSDMKEINENDVKKAIAGAKKVEKLAKQLYDYVPPGDNSLTEIKEATQAAENLRRLYLARQHSLEIRKSHPGISNLFDIVCQGSVDLAQKAYELYKPGPFQSNPKAATFFLLSLLDEKGELKEEYKGVKKIITTNYAFSKSENDITYKKVEGEGLKIRQIAEKAKALAKATSVMDSVPKKYIAIDVVFKNLIFSPPEDNFIKGFKQAYTLFNIYSKKPEFANKLVEKFTSNRAEFEMILDKIESKGFKNIVDFESELASLSNNNDDNQENTIRKLFESYPKELKKWMDPSNSDQAAIIYKMYKINPESVSKVVQMSLGTDIISKALMIWAPIVAANDQKVEKQSKVWSLISTLKSENPDNRLAQILEKLITAPTSSIEEAQERLNDAIALLNMYEELGPEITLDYSKQLSNLLNSHQETEVIPDQAPETLIDHSVSKQKQDETYQENIAESVRGKGAYRVQPPQPKISQAHLLNIEKIKQETGLGGEGGLELAKKLSVLYEKNPYLGDIVYKLYNPPGLFAQKNLGPALLLVRWLIEKDEQTIKPFFNNFGTYEDNPNSIAIHLEQTALIDVLVANAKEIALTRRALSNVKVKEVKTFIDRLTREAFNKLNKALESLNSVAEIVDEKYLTRSELKQAKESKQEQILSHLFSPELTSATALLKIYNQSPEKAKEVTGTSDFTNLGSVELALFVHQASKVNQVNQTNIQKIKNEGYPDIAELLQKVSQGNPFLAAEAFVLYQGKENRFQRNPEAARFLLKSLLGEDGNLKADYKDAVIPPRGDRDMNGKKAYSKSHSDLNHMFSAALRLVTIQSELKTLLKKEPDNPVGYYLKTLMDVDSQPSLIDKKGDMQQVISFYNKYEQHPEAVKKLLQISIVDHFKFTELLNDFSVQDIDNAYNIAKGDIDTVIAAYPSPLDAFIGAQLINQLEKFLIKTQATEEDVSEDAALLHLLYQSNPESAVKLAKIYIADSIQFTDLIHLPSEIRHEAIHAAYIHHTPAINSSIKTSGSAYESLKKLTDDSSTKNALKVLNALHSQVKGEKLEQKLESASSDTKEVITTFYVIRNLYGASSKLKLNLDGHGYSPPPRTTAEPATSAIIFEMIREAIGEPEPPPGQIAHATTRLTTLMGQSSEALLYETAALKLAESLKTHHPERFSDMNSEYITNHIKPDAAQTSYSFSIDPIGHEPRYIHIKASLVINGYRDEPEEEGLLSKIRAEQEILIPFSDITHFLKQPQPEVVLGKELPPSNQPPFPHMQVTQSFTEIPVYTNDFYQATLQKVRDANPTLAANIDLKSEDIKNSVLKLLPKDESLIKNIKDVTYINTLIEDGEILSGIYEKNPYVGERAYALYQEDPKVGHTFLTFIRGFDTIKKIDFSSTTSKEFKKYTEQMQMLEDRLNLAKDLTPINETISTLSKREPNNIVAMHLKMLIPSNNILLEEGNINKLQPAINLNKLYQESPNAAMQLSQVYIVNPRLFTSLLNEFRTSPQQTIKKIQQEFNKNKAGIQSILKLAGGNFLIPFQKAVTYEEIDFMASGIGKNVNIELDTSNHLIPHIANVDMPRMALNMDIGGVKVQEKDQELATDKIFTFIKNSVGSAELNPEGMDQSILRILLIFNQGSLANLTLNGQQYLQNQLRNENPDIDNFPLIIDQPKSEYSIQIDPMEMESPCLHLTSSITGSLIGISVPDEKNKVKSTQKISIPLSDIIAFSNRTDLHQPVIKGENLPIIQESPFPNMKVMQTFL